MNRVIWLLSFVVAGLLLIAIGLTIPAHLRALDARVLLNEQAGSPSLVDEGLALTSQGKIGPAIFILQAAQMERLPESARLQAEIEKYLKAHPDELFLGGADPYLPLLVR